MDGDVAIVVAGIPASGKTTLATELAAHLGWPLLSKDVIKEALFDALGTGDLPWSQQVGRAGHLVMYTLVPGAPRVVLEANFQQGIAEPQLLALHRRLIQVYCRCPVELAVQRYRERRQDPGRHPGHLPEHQSDSATEGWRTGTPTPLHLPDAPLVEVDTSGRVDVAGIAATIRSLAFD
jgi:predicted kinase